MVSGINPEIHLDPWRQNTRLDSYGVFTPIVYKSENYPVLMEQGTQIYM